MMARLVAAASSAAVFVSAPAMAAGWPVAGGDASRSGSVRSDPGDAPVGVSWVKTGNDVRVRTPVIITGGGGPDVQRAAYGTTNGRVHLQVLGTGEPVGPEEGVRVEGGSGTNETSTFGRAGSVGFADTSTQDALGELLVVHNDQNAVYIARIDLRTGRLAASDTPVNGTLGCSIESSPLLTPPDGSGGRLLYFTIDGVCTAGRGLVRVPVIGGVPSDAPGSQTIAPVPLIPRASPSLVVLRDSAGTPRFHVAVAREGGVDFFDANQRLSDTVPPAAVAPAITARFAGDARTVSAPVAANGLLAGAAGSGTPPAPSLYVASEFDRTGRVHRLVQRGNARELEVERTSAAIGVPGPALAVTETMTPAGPTPDGVLVVPSATNLTLLRASDLAVLGRLSSEPLRAGRGFAHTVPLVAGGLAYIARDGDVTTPAEHLVLRVDNALAPLSSPAFTPASESTQPGSAFGQPAFARGWVVMGSGPGAVAYRNRDITPPSVTLDELPSTLEPGSPLSARAGDARGMAEVQWRLLGAGAPRVLGVDRTPDGGDPLREATWSAVVATAGVPAGDYELEAVATDRFGNVALSERRRVRVAGVETPLPPGACAVTVLGTRRADRLVGTPAGERLVGGAGNDRLSAGRGDDCLLGQSGRDVLSAGPGADLLDGGSGNDRLSGGSGNDRLKPGRGRDTVHGGAGHDVIAARDRARDRIRCGRGRDRVIADRKDRVARDCERVSRR